MGSSCLLVAAVLLQLVGLSASNRASTNLEYEEFRLIHRSGETERDAAMYAQRHKLFAQRSAQVKAHNEAGHSWTMIANHFADYTQSELDMHLGYKRVGGRWSDSSGGSSFLQVGTSELETIDVSSLAKTVDWRSKMNVSNFVHNQGGCGSCWAHAAVAALEAHAELTSGISKKFATQEIIDCTANPRECGGSGGCQGATAEMAFEYARKYGIAEEGAYKGAGGNCATGTPSITRAKSFVRLPENRGSFLLHALATKGPVALSIDAANLFMYNGGVFDGCKQDTVVNHAVLGVGYGTDAASGKDYWLIKNSWGGSWGENGYIRNLRHANDDDYCGTDDKPQEGVYCKEHPATIRVCGMCGITSDSAYPVMFPKTALRQRNPQSQPRLMDVKLSSIPEGSVVY